MHLPDLPQWKHTSEVLNSRLQNYKYFETAVAFRVQLQQLSLYIYKEGTYIRMYSMYMESQDHTN